MPQIEYPIKIILNFIFDTDNFIPPISYELFDLRTLILKIIIHSNLITFDNNQLDISLINKLLIILFSLLYLFSILFVIFKIFKLKNQNKTKLSKKNKLIKFYILSGFSFILLFFEVSIEKSLMYFLCILSPLIVNNFSNFKLSYGALALFFIGLLFYGNILPVSIMDKLNLFNFHKVLFYYPNELMGWKGFIFSHAPYFGAFLIFLSFMNVKKM